MLSALVASTLAYASVLIAVPHVEQRPDFCGEACASMGLAHFGISITQDQVFTFSGVDPLKGRGLVTDELARTLTRLGFDVGQVWTHVDPQRAEVEREAAFAALHHDLMRGVPSIICGWSSFGPNRTQHMRLVVGYDEAQDEVLLEDPAQSEASLTRLKRDAFVELWTFKPSATRWNLIRMALAKKADAKTPSLPQDTRAAELSQHVQVLKEQSPKGFTFVDGGPFLVIGDEAPDTVRRRAKDTVEWTRRLLKKDFFDEDPDGFTDVWIFKDRQSYEKHAVRLFGDKPTTPYGYYLPSHRAMVMNIKPGYGTLVHELVHPYVAKNCATCPAWLNEGLASLYERPAEREGHLVGLPNWRLPGLKAALKVKAVPSFKSLLRLSDAAFYDDDTGVYYAQARYLCYWLQEHGQLVALVKGMQTRPADDASGEGVLSALVGNLEAFDARWAQDTLAITSK